MASATNLGPTADVNGEGAPAGRVPSRPAVAARPAARCAETPAPSRQEEPGDDPRESYFTHFKRILPVWLISMLVHAILLLVLASITLSPSEDKPSRFLTLDESTAVTEELQEFQIEQLAEEVSLEELAESANSLGEPDSDLLEPMDVLTGSSLDPQTSGMTSLAPSVVTVTAALPPGIGDGEFYQEFSSGPGQGEAVQFYGTKVKGRFAVVFDTTGSMFSSVQSVLEVLDSPQFRHAQVVAVFGGGFAKPKKEPFLIPYRYNKPVHAIEIKAAPAGQRELRDKIYNQMLARERTASVELLSMRQSLGAGIHALLLQARPPRVIFVFSDFMDGIDEQYMQSVQQLAVERKVKVVVYHPQRFAKDRAAYQAFAAATGGQLQEQFQK